MIWAFILIGFLSTNSVNQIMNFNELNLPNCYLLYNWKKQAHLFHSCMKYGPNLNIISQLKANWFQFTHASAYSKMYKSKKSADGPLRYLRFSISLILGV